MRVIARSTWIAFCEKMPKASRASARAALLEWHTVVEAARWNNFADVKATFNSADYVSDGKIVFDVGGNKFRVVALVGFRTKRVFILFVGTHQEYDKIDVKKL
ncbi:MAG: type II toxin-antitoxin system HigB family toxin [Pseudomonadota bacterium]|nr:type II toxin-antitoxin system HigB family toxin [Pseudomonadota bacterium]